ncbi:hypothetical protein [Asanoa siamensis]|uniref:Uncharacterized protein n=1 Tax=Asanoa siamensis TaxID=926357 RepID=A0ABQ4D0I0_9ACTN|nr:hypothetical protein [Asanoa siamensis]GIF77054.1 hypothetical protein Asi02nite_65720 [Asanoa siamensis]
MVFVIVATASVAAGFLTSPAASTNELPQSITVDGADYERIHLLTFTTYPGRKSVSVLMPATSRPIMVRAACRLPILHTGSAMSALMVETWWMDAGGSEADLPDTEGNDHLMCHPNWGNHRLTQTIDPSWLPRKDGQRQLIWHELDTSADTPSDAPASWALAVYTAG